MTKKICHITSVHPRYDGRIFRKMCVSLANNGYDVTLLVIDNKPDEVKDGVHIIPIDKQFKNSFDRIFNSWKFLYKKALEINADIYHLHDPELIQLGTKLKQKGKKVIFDSHEDYVLSILQKNWLPQFSRTLVQKMYAKYEKKKLAKFDGIIGVTPQLMTHLKTINDNIVMITNYPLLENVKRKDSSGFTLCFAGGITPNWSHESIIKAVNKFEGAVRYNLMGNIDDRYKEKLQMLEGFKYVNLIGTVSYHDVLEYYGASSLGIALHKYMPMVYDHEGSLGNTKIFEMMMSELPVICTDFTLWTEIIEKNQTGKCINPHSVQEIYDAIAFFYVDQLYDYKSLVDYVIINSFVVCSDWLNWNVGWWRGLNPDGTHQKWGYILWDEDAILGHYVNYTGIPGQHPYVSPCYPEYLSSYSDPQKHVEILKKLMYNPDFYQYYVSRYIDLLNTAFVKERLIASIDSIADVFRPEMPKHIERWGGNMTKWENNVQKLRNFISNRVDYVPSGLKSCYDLTGPFPITVNVEPAGSGIIRLNSLELGEFPWDANYFGNIDIKLEALTSKVEFEFDYWEISNHTPTPDTSSTTITLNLINNADITAHFKLKTYTDSLIINEINYKSATWFNTEDWIEFYNPHNYDLDISNWLFKDGNDNNSYFFPPNTIIAANGYLVLCRDTTAFKSLQPLVTNYLGNMDFGFSANGELLRLYNSEGLLIDTVHYGNDDPWPPEANGLGPTLELIKPSLDNAQPENWMASAANGTPGAMNSLIAEIKEKKNLKEKFAISVFPNPANENVYIWIHEENLIKNGLIQIYNSMGRKVFHKENIRSDKHEINVMDFPDGLYIVKFYDKGTELSASSKLIINRK
jgi:glycosyltransferase involved in cell wall biosynthesis